MTKALCFLLYPLFLLGWVCGVGLHMFLFGMMGARNALIKWVEELNQ